MPKISAEARVSRRLRFRDLHVFLAVVECGSMGKAAVQLGTTQPSVSELISGLESTIGARLFDRNAQGVEPTLYGQSMGVLQYGLNDGRFGLYGALEGATDGGWRLHSGSDVGRLYVDAGWRLGDSEIHFVASGAQSL